ncbi:hypothetical protein EPA93_40715 [Ktedonosporobacter rubrisoli]|uniref:GxGYxYP putative glycoside hydrolase N-terminal domain-containing protein n=1 Tax=Ktedonosporobacter rubrisoli TaxID=2509675 RepID=A0A4P6K1D2_KTERU|nr:GxGYxYP domain-containing protein [Ktedonosporobacter rubrisoli]QBD81967.1 hypothetical protein EPA93_40715 [Ktedonosporobacter rubrisoli]
MANEDGFLDWSADRILPAFQEPRHLVAYDIRGAPYDIQLAVTTLTGLLNRQRPSVYLISNEDDIFWLRQAFGDVPHDISSARNEEILAALLGSSAESVRGLIIYDPALRDTVNVATMLAGLQDGLVASPHLARALQIEHALPVLTDLRDHHWRSRGQAYCWALENLLPRTSSRLLAGLDPANVSGLRAFLVATRTFIYWLDSRQRWPDPRAGWISERALLQRIIAAFKPGAAHLGWFRDESSGVKLTSRAAMLVLASDHFTNLETWTAMRPQARYQHQISQREVQPSADKVYVAFTISDGDNLQYCQHRLRRLWQDQARGKLPIGWTLSPLIGQATPMLAAYYLESATSQDELIAGPSGAGYMFPSYWPAEHLKLFLQHTGSAMQAMGMTSLEVLDTDFWQSAGLPLLSRLSLNGMRFRDIGRHQRFVTELEPFGLRGIFSGAGRRNIQWKRVKDIPLYHNLGLAGSINGTLKLIQRAAKRYPQRPLFLHVYMLAWSITPSDLLQIVERLGDGYEVVLPAELLALLIAQQ